MTKICTSIEQSKKLVELGLSQKTADMSYIETPINEFRLMAYNYKETVVLRDLRGSDAIVYPCWSLAALLGVLPQSINKYIESERCQKTFHLNLFRSYYCCVSYDEIPSVNDDNSLYCIGRDNWVDACYEMILKLNELNLL